VRRNTVIAVAILLLAILVMGMLSVLQISSVPR
jgi:hypothetical protein